MMLTFIQGLRDNDKHQTCVIIHTEKNITEKKSTNSLPNTYRLNICSRSFFFSNCIMFLLFQAFNVVFDKAIDRAEPAEEVHSRVINLIDCITYSVYVYTSRGLFERDKLIFTTQMAFQVFVFISFHLPFRLSPSGGVLLVSSFGGVVDGG